MFLDRWVAAILPPLAFWILLNGLDDFILNILWLWTWLFGKALDLPEAAEPERPVAIFVPLWREHRVIRHMVEHNIASQKFASFHFFIGAYPNDAPTLAALADLEARHSQVHIAQCPHPGPTSKADCLNWIYQRMLLYEEEHAIRFETVMTHDAEDLIHPEALWLIDRYTRVYGMVQIPVLALPTSWRELTHGVYCDEFAQFQFRDMPVRNRVGGFVPSNGVGTGFSREAIEALAAAHKNRIFEPSCLTEDYENGYRVHRLGFRQLFIPLMKIGGSFAATREYFPRSYRAAVRQRTRWTTGIALQSWEYHGVRETLAQLWWFWRDRKTVVNNLLTPAIQMLTLYGGVTLAASASTHQPWPLAGMFPPAVNWSLALIGTLHLAIRAGTSARVYGWGFAATTPLRMVWGNWINFVASASALRRYAVSRATGRPLVWLKTEHAYPSRTTLLNHELVASPDEDAVSLAVTRSLPAALSRRWQVLPFQISAGHLHLAGVAAPTDELHVELAGLCSLEIRFHKISEEDYRSLSAKYLPEETTGPADITGFAEEPAQIAVPSE